MATSKARDLGLARWAAVLWHSPTFTTWGSYAAQTLRLLLVTPLLLTRFEAPEIAAWYLFGGLMFVGDAVNARIGMTFSRMIAFAAAGAEHLSPIKGASVSAASGSAPNFQLLSRAFGTIGFMNLMVTGGSALVAIGLAAYGLPKILSEAASASSILAAFGILVASKCITDILQRYALTMRGLNHVAQVNRWETLFSLLSVVVGALALKAGANIWQLALVMESVMLFRSLLFRHLCRNVESGLFARSRSYAWDKEVFAWAKEPLFKGMAISFANVGALQMATLVYARHGAVQATAALLLSMRLLSAVQQISSAPFASHQPLLSRLLAQGKTDEVRHLCLSRIGKGQILFALGVAALALAGNWLLGMMNANARLLDSLALSCLGLGMALNLYLLQTLTVMAAGNDMVCYRRAVAAGVVSVCLSFLLIPAYGVIGFIASAFGANLLFLNLAPIRIAAERLGTTSGSYLKSTLAPGASIATAVLLFFALRG